MTDPLAPGGGYAPVRLKIGHVLFLDIVGYSKLLIGEQSEALQKLNNIVREAEAVRQAEANNGVILLPTGDGMALVFTDSVEAPVEAALQISGSLKNFPALGVRMGIHSGPVNQVADVTGRTNVAGAGINLAQRVMDCGDAGHILVSRHVAEDLEHYGHWRPLLHDLGECEVKHGTRVHVFNLYRQEADEFGNSRRPTKLAVEKTRPAAKQTHHPLVYLIPIVALLVPAIIFGPKILGDRKSRYDRTGPNGPSISPKSIAVLPFENLSDDKANAYFADGIQDEILTRLSKISALKVISRTSTQRYKSTPDNLSEIGQQLGVAHLLEGSVQKAGNAVHINVQLIRAATDEHVWAESYNRSLANVFAVEGEVATAIADQLQAKLTGSERETLASKPTQNPAAYDAYLRGVAYEGRVDDLRTSWLNAAQAFAEAVRTDPNFALAWAHLASAEALLFVGVEETPAHRDAAANALQKATQLGPDLVETKIANGLYLAWVGRDYEKARTQLEEAHRLYPNNANAIRVLAGINRRQGRWKESRALFEQALELDPQNVSFLADASLVGLETRDAAWARKILQRAVDLSPQNATVVAELASTYQLTGDIKQAQTVLEGAQPKEGDSFYINIFQYNAVLQRNYQPAINLLKKQLEKVGNSGSTFSIYESSLADLQRRAGDTQEGELSFRKAKTATEELLHTEPNNADVVATLAVIEAGLSEKDAALKYARQAVALMPRAKEPRIGPGYEDTLARLQARFGDKESAIAALKSLINTPYSYPNVTPALLRLDPDFDNLRGDPRFEQLCEEPNK